MTCTVIVARLHSYKNVNERGPGAPNATRRFFKMAVGKKFQLKNGNSKSLDITSVERFVDFNFFP